MDTHKIIFGSNDPPHPRGGKVALAAEEGMIRNLTNQVISEELRAFDAELGHFQATSQIIDQVYSTIDRPRQVIVGTAPPSQR